MTGQYIVTRRHKLKSNGHYVWRFNIIRRRDNGSTYAMSFTQKSLRELADQIQDILDVHEEETAASTE